jgi:hypothetical protein
VPNVSDVVSVVYNGVSLDVQQEENANGTTWLVRVYAMILACLRNHKHVIAQPKCFSSHLNTMIECHSEADHADFMYHSVVSRSKHSPSQQDSSKNRQQNNGAATGSVHPSFGWLGLSHVPRASVFYVPIDRGVGS